MTLTDPKTEYALCPWCKQPGKLIVRQTYSSADRKWAIGYRVGCKNVDCPVQPRTKPIHVIDTQGDDIKQAAIRYSIEKWERRE